MTTYATDSQGKFIPATQRPDGTWRKPRRVRDGYIPQEEVPLYESKGKLFAQKPALPPGMSPEMAQKMKEKREQEQRIRQQREAAEAARRSAQNAQHQTPGLLILHSDSGNKHQQNQSQQQRQQNAKPSKPKKKAAELPDVLLEQRQRDEQKQARQLQQNQKTAKSQQTKSQQLDDATKTFNDLSLSNSNSLGGEASEGHTDLSKKLRKLRKKIREIEIIEERLRVSDGPRPDKDQIEKAKRKPEILKEIEELEKTIPN
ncbi:partner of Y14 and mago [Uranotaenia lowii]|uniref:partner of Y14 and mago n=1 Tax=Uranotaenia lowii TaxID=190385 RepID=UPI0024790D54|nr:partner of Y14 and mago [Uranotaenia lowii]